jgi:sialic acid synthase SpsE
MKKIYFIADLGLNHNGIFKRACDLIFHAKQCGFNAVKFQLYDAERLSPNSEVRELLSAGQFDKEWLPELRELCDNLNIDLAVTPFYPEAVGIIAPYVDWIKIGSYELHYIDLVYEATMSELPIIASAGFVQNPTGGMHIKNLKALLYCVPKYPCGVGDIDMNWIKFARERSSFPVGWSDHSHNSNVIWSALIAGAEYVEMHFDLDGKGLEYKQGHVWSSVECFNLIHNIRESEKCFEPTDFVPDYSKRTNQQGRRS